MSMQVDWHALAHTDRDERERTEDQKHGKLCRRIVHETAMAVRDYLWTREEAQITEISSTIGERNNRVAYVLRQKRTMFIVSQPTEKNTRPSALVRLNPSFYPPLAERVKARAVSGG